MIPEDFEGAFSEPPEAKTSVRRREVLEKNPEDPSRFQEVPVEGEVSKGRKILSLVFSLGVAFLMLGVVFAIATPKFSAARGRANIRACYANQKTFAGALEMYQMDHPVAVGSLEEVAPGLVSGGYLQTFPKDPGEPPSTQNYELVTALGSCREHRRDPHLECEACHARDFLHVRCKKHGAVAKQLCPQHLPPLKKSDP